MHEALIVGLIVALIVVTERILAAPLIIRPIVTCPLVGLALGDFQTGLLAGATLEVTFMGAVQIGASLPADATVGGAIGVALAVMSGRGLESVMVIALPVAVAASTLKLIMFTVRSYYSSGSRLCVSAAADVKEGDLSVFPAGLYPGLLHGPGNGADHHYRLCDRVYHYI